MERDHLPADLDAAPDADYIEQTIPADPNAVDAVDIEALSTELDSTWPPPEGDLIEQSIPAPSTATTEFPAWGTYNRESADTADRRCALRNRPQPHRRQSATDLAADRFNRRAERTHPLGRSSRHATTDRRQRPRISQHPDDSRRATRTGQRDHQTATSRSTLGPYPSPMPSKHGLTPPPAACGSSSHRSHDPTQHAPDQPQPRIVTPANRS